MMGIASECSQRTQAEPQKTQIRGRNFFAHTRVFGAKVAALSPSLSLQRQMKNIQEHTSLDLLGLAPHAQEGKAQGAGAAAVRLKAAHSAGEAIQQRPAMILER